MTASVTPIRATIDREIRAATWRDMLAAQREKTAQAWQGCRENVQRGRPREAWIMLLFAASGHLAIAAMRRLARVDGVEM